MRKTFFTNAVATFFILLFVYAAVSKLTSYQDFYQQLTQSPLLTGFARSASLLVPAGEIFIAVLLWLPSLRLAGLFAAFSVMLLFTWYVFVIIFFSDYIPCSCGGILAAMTWQQHLIFNTACVLLAGVAILLYESPAPDAEAAQELFVSHMHNSL